MIIARLNKLKAHSISQINRIKSFDPLSKLSETMVTDAGITYSDFRERIQAISDCASVIELKEAFDTLPDGTFEQKLSVATANYCKNPHICPICADRSQSRRRARYDREIKRQASLTRSGARYAYIMTYTVRDGGSLSERLEHLKESKRRFRTMGQRRNGKRSGGEAAKITAAVSTIEIKRGEGSSLWHPHAHDLVFTDRPIDYQVYDKAARRELKARYGNRIPRGELMKIALGTVMLDGETVPVSKLTREWYIATGGDSCGLDITPLKHIPDGVSEKVRRKLSAMTFEQSIAYQAREVLKYPVKPYDFANDLLMVVSETYNKRLTATYGEFRGIPGDDYLDEPGADDTSYVMCWENDGYGDPQPGTMRAMLAGDEAERQVRIECGKLLGEYRRRRRELLGNRISLGESLSEALDTAKEFFRRKISSHWSRLRQSVSHVKSTDLKGCDKYSDLLILNGIFVPESDSRDVYINAFT